MCRHHNVGTRQDVSLWMHEKTSTCRHDSFTLMQNHAILYQLFSINSAAEVDNLCPRCLRLAPPSSPLCHCSSGQPHSKIVQGTDPEEIQLSRLRYFFPAISQLWFHSLRGYPGKGYLSKKGYCLSCFKYSQVLDWVYQFLIKEAKAKAFSFGVG